MRRSLILLVLSLLARASAPAQETLAPDPWKAFVGDLREKMEDVDQLGEVAVPLLQPIASIRKWGSPRYRRSADGGYWMIYSNPDPKKPFDRVIILASPKPIPTLSAVPDMVEEAEINGELGVVKKPQTGKSVAVKWKAPGGKVEKTLRYFRHDNGGGADGALDMTDAFSITSGGKTGYYVVSVETIVDATEKRLKMLEVAP